MNKIQRGELPRSALQSSTGGRFFSQDSHLSPHLRGGKENSRAHSALMKIPLVVSSRFFYAVSDERNNFPNNPRVYL
jgi:hypothetical protein